MQSSIICKGVEKLTKRRKTQSLSLSFSYRSIRLVSWHFTHGTQKNKLLYLTNLDTLKFLVICGTWSRWFKWM